MLRTITGTTAAAALLLTASSFIPLKQTAAEARPSTKSFTCAGARRFVRERGAVVMNHKAPHLYQRFVANSSYCDYEERARPFRVPTKSGSCTLKTCQFEERVRFFDD